MEKLLCKIASREVRACEKNRPTDIKGSQEAEEMLQAVDTRDSLEALEKTMVRQDVPP